MAILFWVKFSHELFQMLGHHAKGSPPGKDLVPEESSFALAELPGPDAPGSRINCASEAASCCQQRHRVKSYVPGLVFMVKLLP